MGDWIAHDVTERRTVASGERGQSIRAAGARGVQAAVSLTGWSEPRLWRAEGDRSRVGATPPTSSGCSVVAPGVDPGTWTAGSDGRRRGPSRVPARSADAPWARAVRLRTRWSMTEPHRGPLATVGGAGLASLACEPDLRWAAPGRPCSRRPTERAAVCAPTSETCPCWTADARRSTPRLVPADEAALGLSERSAASAHTRMHRAHPGWPQPSRRSDAVERGTLQTVRKVFAHRRHAALAAPSTRHAVPPTDELRCSCGSPMAQALCPTGVSGAGTNTSLVRSCPESFGKTRPEMSADFFHFVWRSMAHGSLRLPVEGIAPVHVRTAEAPSDSVLRPYTPVAEVTDDGVVLGGAAAAERGNRRRDGRGDRLSCTTRFRPRGYVCGDHRRPDRCRVRRRRAKL